MQIGIPKFCIMVLPVLKLWPNGLYSSQIAQMLGLNPRQAGQLMRRLSLRGYVDKVGARRDDQMWRPAKEPFWVRIGVEE